MSITLTTAELALGILPGSRLAIANDHSNACASAAIPKFPSQGASEAVGFTLGTCRHLGTCQNSIGDHGKACRSVSWRSDKLDESDIVTLGE